MLLSQASSRGDSAATSDVGVWSRHGETAESRFPEAAMHAGSGDVEKEAETEDVRETDGGVSERRRAGS